jgi:hypothetical protein
LAAVTVDLNTVTATEIDHDGKRFGLRPTPQSVASLALRAAAPAQPRTVQTIAATRTQ